MRCWVLMISGARPWWRSEGWALMRCWALMISGVKPWWRSEGWALMRCWAPMVSGAKPWSILRQTRKFSYIWFWFVCQQLAAEGILFSGCLCVIIDDNAASYKLLVAISTNLQLWCSWDKDETFWGQKVKVTARPRKVKQAQVLWGTFSHLSLESVKLTTISSLLFVMSSCGLSACVYMNMNESSYSLHSPYDTDDVCFRGQGHKQDFQKYALFLQNHTSWWIAVKERLVFVIVSCTRCVVCV